MKDLFRMFARKKDPVDPNRVTVNDIMTVYGGSWEPEKKSGDCSNPQAGTCKLEGYRLKLDNQDGSFACSDVVTEESLEKMRFHIVRQLIVVGSGQPVETVLEPSYGFRSGLRELRVFTDDLEKRRANGGGNFNDGSKAGHNGLPVIEEKFGCGKGLDQNTVPKQAANPKASQPALEGLENNK